eukprot:scaffold938_cov334-Pavlova_lutheri.AAC.34
MHIITAVVTSTSIEMCISPSKSIRNVGVCALKNDYPIGRPTHVGCFAPNLHCDRSVQATAKSCKQQIELAGTRRMRLCLPIEAPLQNEPFKEGQPNLPSQREKDTHHKTSSTRTNSW